MQQTNAPVQIKDSTANPAPLGLLAFGMTTVLLNIHNAGFYGMTTMILAMGIFYGGLAQVFAGVMEWKKGNTFGTTAFLSYGLFWLSVVGLLVMPKLNWGTAPDNGVMAAYFFMWGLFTFIMTFGAAKANRALWFVFASLTVLFWLLALGEATTNSTITKVAGWEGIICGLSAMYTGLAQVLNEMYGKVVWSIWPAKK